MQFSRARLSLGNLPLSCRALFPYIFRLSVKQVDSRVALRGSTLVTASFLYFYYRPYWTHNAHMGRSAGVVGFLEEDQVSGLCLTFRNNVAFSHQTIGRLSVYMPAIAAVVDDPADKAGTIKARARRAAAPE